MASPPKMSAESQSDTRLFGRYSLIREIASGGMGNVYLARVSGAAGFEKVVALKRIHEHMAKDRRFVTMFLDEAQIAARIQHPNVCSVIDFGVIDGKYYLTMPYILGRQLNRVVHTAATRTDKIGGQLPVMGLRLIADACEGLHAAHELRGEDGSLLEVVHRDVSPQNLLVGYDGVVRVLDFGVASAKHRRYQTSTGEVKGKFAYCSPEHIAGQPVDRRADVWSLGVVLWETTTGRRLFTRDNVVATIRAVADMPIPALVEARPDVPEGVQAICDRALSRELENRYATAREMGRDLLRVLAKQDDIIAAPDVADWLGRLFPAGLAKEEALIEMTKTSDISFIGPLSASFDDSGSGGYQAIAFRDSATVDRPPSIEPKEGSGWAGKVLLALLALVCLTASAVAGALAIVGLGDGPQEIASTTLPSSVEPPTPVAPAPSPADDRETAPTDDRLDVHVASEPATVTPVAPVDPSPEVADEPRPTPRQPRRQGPPGRLNVAPNGGWALVFFNGRRLGDAPGVFEIPSGRQVVHVQPFGRGRRIPYRVVIPPGGTRTLQVPVR